MEAGHWSRQNILQWLYVYLSMKSNIFFTLQIYAEDLPWFFKVAAPVFPCLEGDPTIISLKFRKILMPPMTRNHPDKLQAPYQK